MLDPVRIQFEDFSVDEELTALRTSSQRMGGIATFIGCARDFSDGREVSEISFDAYGSMALAEMNALRNDAIEKFALLDARIVHRIGVIGAGEQIVFIATGAEHRAPALQACQWLIDQLKKRVPIWKKEITPSGRHMDHQSPMSGALKSPPVFIFVGHSGSGKTTLIEKLVHRLSDHGLRVATIKHAHHKVVLDTPGKDSWRYKQAGAVMSMLVTSNELQLIADAVDQREPAQLAQRFLGEADIVLAEGFSHATGVKIEVLRREHSTTPRCTIEDELIAMVTDITEVYPQLPHFALDNIGEIVQFMLDRLP